MQDTYDWTREFPGAVTVCDTDGIILSMNEKSIATFASYGGAELIGKSVLDCHPEPARARLMELMREQRVNSYTIEKGGRKKLIYQAPWYRDGKWAGIVEISLEIPFDMEHFVRS
jgi:PAS domain S-box-containing protein